MDGRRPGTVRVFRAASERIIREDPAMFETEVITFRKGVLKIHEDGSLTIVRAWPDLRGARRRPGQGWSLIVPDIDIPAVSDAELDLLHNESYVAKMAEWDAMRSVMYHQNNLAMGEFLRTIPQRVRMSVGRFSFSSCRWLLLTKVARCSGFLDMLDSSPALCFCLAHRLAFARKGDPGLRRRTEDILKMKQRDILARLGFPGTESAAKVFRKIAPLAVSKQRMLSLRSRIRDKDALKALRHLPRITLACLEIILSPELMAHAAPTLLEDIAETSEDPVELDDQVFPNDQWGFASVLAEVLEMFRRLRPGVSAPRFRSVSMLRAAYRPMASRARSIREEELLRTPFPDPPLQGTADIQALSEPRAVLEEAEAQHNCVAGFIPDIRDRKCYLYRVQAPERATLSIVPTRGRGGWKIGELAGACNVDEKPETRDAVLHWLQGVGPEAPAREAVGA